MVSAEGSGVIRMISDINYKVIAVVGLGYVGLPLAESFSQHFRVIGFDVNQKKIDKLASGDVRFELSSDPIALSDADIVIIASEHNLDPWLLISTIYRESSFKMNAVGKLGEKGLGQVHGIAKMKCDLKTQYGQIDCAASWLSKMINKCGSVNRGVSAYLSGKCKPSGKVLSAIRRRVRLAKRLKNGYCSD